VVVIVGVVESTSLDELVSHIAVCARSVGQAVSARSGVIPVPPFALIGYFAVCGLRLQGESVVCSVASGAV
jgi:hypothetical protein